VGGVRLLAVAVVGIGLFVAAVWAMSAAFGLVEGHAARAAGDASEADERVGLDASRGSSQAVGAHSG
jgi:hypothetical protein